MIIFLLLGFTPWLLLLTLALALYLTVIELRELTAALRAGGSGGSSSSS